MKYIVTINNKEYEVEVEKGVANVLSTKAVAPVVPAASAAPATAAEKPVSVPVAPVVADENKAIKAPFPGMVVDVKVGAGSNVKKGETLLLLEAMKMENEITAPADGVVAQVLAQKGANVETSDVLVVMR